MNPTLISSQTSEALIHPPRLCRAFVGLSAPNMFFVPPTILISFDVLLFKVGGKSREDALLSDSVGPAVCTQAFLYLCTDSDGPAAPLQSRPVALITHFIFPSSLLSAGRDSLSLCWFHRAACRLYVSTGSYFVNELSDPPLVSWCFILLRAAGLISRHC